MIPSGRGGHSRRSGRHLRRSGRRILGRVLRGRWRGLSRDDHWINFWNLLAGGGAAWAECPICRYSGPFLSFAGRPRQICPQCDGRSRHRVIRLAIDAWQEQYGRLSFERGLHIAPEPCLTSMLESHGGSLWTGDIQAIAQTALDLRALPLADGSLDFFFASHVLEHVVEDRQALSEIYRVLEPGGLAILVVPITAEATVEFDEVIAQRNFHARDCGPDYFDRYREAGFELTLFRSDEMADVQRYALTSVLAQGEVVHWIPFCRKPLA